MPQPSRQVREHLAVVRDHAEGRAEGDGDAGQPRSSARNGSKADATAGDQPNAASRPGSGFRDRRHSMVRPSAHDPAPLSHALSWSGKSLDQRGRPTRALAPPVRRHQSAAVAVIGRHVGAHAE
jgi:hypothetical protein